MFLFLELLTTDQNTPLTFSLEIKQNNQLNFHCTTITEQKLQIQHTYNTQNPLPQYMRSYYTLYNTKNHATTAGKHPHVHTFKQEKTQLNIYHTQADVTTIHTRQTEHFCWPN